MNVWNFWACIKMHVGHFYPLLKWSQECSMFYITVIYFSIHNRKKSHCRLLTSTTKAGEGTSCEAQSCFDSNFLKSSNPLTWNVKPHKVLWTSWVAVVLHGCGVFTMRSVFVSSGEKGISRRMKSPGPLKTWMGLSRRWTSWRGCEFAIAHVFTLKMWYNKFNKWSWLWRFFLPQISAGEPDPIRHQEVFLRFGRLAAPVSPPRASDCFQEL